MRVARELDRIAELRRYPCMIVSDNGTELTSNAILAWQQQRGVEWHYMRFVQVVDGRNPELLVRKKTEDNLRHRENIFVIHGRDEAKWRELKDILKSEFRLNPVVLFQQPDAGCTTVIEKFEHYAPTCSYAIAVFTPDDEVADSNGAKYLQARPNVIYELGWFCGRLGRSGAMLLLKENTSIFSDFGGIIQKRFQQNISEKIIEIKRDLVTAGIIDDV